MNYLIIAISAYLLNAVSVTIDKILLVKRLPNPALYVFYISAFSLAVLIAAPFTPFPDFKPLVISSFSTILWTLGAYYMFKALKSGEAARVIPIIGTLIPVILLSMSALSGSVDLNEIWAVLILLAGLVFLIYPSLKGKFSKEELILELVSALFFANSYHLLKISYDSSNFLSIFIYSRLILLPLIIIILIIPFLRRWVFAGSTHHPKVSLWSKTGFILFIGQAAGGSSQMLLTFAISLASPAVVNSIQGIQYVFLFILSLLLAKKFPTAFAEKLTKVNIAGKIIGIMFIFFGLWLLSFSTDTNPKAKLGVTFSPRYAEELGLDPDEVFDALVTDLKPGIVRLPVYWDEVEIEKGKYNFSKTESYLNRLEKNNIQAVLVVGFKQPRWPECFQPTWSKTEQEPDFSDSILKLVKEEVTYFKKHQNIKYWQLENEPFLDFGICPRPNYERVHEELELLKSIDSRPVLMTDSGELSTWLPVLKTADIFGTTLYRTVWNPWFGIVEYPWPPAFYTIKAQLTRFLTGSLHKPVIISELQAEPWPDEKKSLGQVPINEQLSLFSTNKFLENVDYARQTKFDEIYLWGIEWWFFMKKNHVSDYWLTAKILFSD